MWLIKEFIPSWKNEQELKTENDFNELLEFTDNEELDNDKKVDINKQIINKETLLHLATWKGYDNVCSQLLKKGANVNLTDDTLRTAMHLAVKSNNHKMVKILLETNYDYFYYSGFAIKDIDGNTPLMIAEKKGYKAIADLLNLDNIINKIKKHTQEQLKKNQYDEETEKVIYNNFEFHLNDSYKILKEIQILNKNSERLTSKKSRWLNFITFGFFNNNIEKKRMKIANVIDAKSKALISKNEKIQKIVETIKKMAAVAEKNKILTKKNQDLYNSNLIQKKKIVVLEQQVSELQAKINSNNEKINELNITLQNNENQISNLNEVLISYQTVQSEYNDKSVSKFLNLNNTIRGLEDANNFLKAQIKSLQKEIANADNGDSGIELGCEAITSDSKSFNKKSVNTMESQTSSKKDIIKHPTV